MAVPTYRASTAYTDWGGSTSAIVNKPTGTVEGDLMVAVYVSATGAFYGTVADLTPPSGWTTVSELLISNAPIVGLYYKIAGASEPSTYTWSVNDGGDRCLGIATVTTGTFDATTPVGTTNGVDWSRLFQPSSSTSVTAPTITPAVDECLGIAFYGATSGGFTWTTPSGYTERFDGTNGGPSMSIHTKALTTSATGSVTATASSAVGTNEGAGVLFAVRPVAGGGPATVTRTGSLSGTGTLAATRLLARLRTGSAAGTGTLAGTRLIKRLRTASLAGTASLASTRLIKQLRTGSVTGTGTLTGVGINASGTKARTGSLAGTGTLTGSGTRIVAKTGSLTGTGTLAATKLRKLLRTGSLTGTGTLAAIGAKLTSVVTRTGAVTGSGSLSATGRKIVKRTGSLVATGLLGASGRRLLSTPLWVPQFSGIVESWEGSITGLGTEAFINVTAVETISRLGRVDENAIALEGNDDTPETRIVRLGDRAGWLFGYIDEFTNEPATPAFNYLLQSTDMAINRLAEIYLTADSVGAIARTDRTGALLIHEDFSEYATTDIAKRFEVATRYLGPDVVPGLSGLQAEYLSDSLHVENDDDPIINTISIARQGGTARTGTDTFSVAKYGKHTFTRNDFISKDDALVDFIITKMLDDNRNAPLRISSLDLTALDDHAIAFQIDLDVRNHLTVVLQPELEDSDGNRWIAYVTGVSVDSYTHRVIPMTRVEVDWNTNIIFGSSVNDIQLIPL